MKLLWFCQEACYCLECVLVLGYADLSHRVTASRETEPRTETRGTSQVSAAAGHCTPAAVRIRRVQGFLNFDIDA